MSLKFIALSLIVFSSCSMLQASLPGSSAVTTLTFPFGARTTGMAECGTALTDNQAALFYNPAGLAVKNRAWEGGSFSNFYEQSLPDFNINDRWHSCMSGYYQPGDKAWGGFGCFVNHLKMGKNTPVDAYGRETGAAERSTEDVYALGWGFNFNRNGISNNNFGLTFKYVNSRLAPGIGNDECVAQTFAIDIGYLLTSRSGLRLGFTAMNMGPNIFYIDKENADPLPFTMNLALAYEKRIFYDENINMSIATETRCERELVKNDFDGKPDPFYKAIYTDPVDTSFKQNIHECVWHFGFELGIMNTGFIRHGYLIYISGVRFEQTIGFGIRLFNHLNFDYSYIHSPEGYLKGTVWTDEGSSGLRDHQTRISFAYTSLIRHWTDDDLQWWKSR